MAELIREQFGKVPSIIIALAMRAALKERFINYEEYCELENELDGFAKRN